MAASGKPTAVHFSLIFFVMLSLILGVMFYLNFKHIQENQANWMKAQEDLKTEQRLTRKQDEEIQALKRLTGHVYEDVGTEGAAAGTVIGAIQADLAKAAPLAEETYKAAVDKLVKDVANVTSERDKLQQNLTAEHKALLALQQQYQARVDQHQKARDKAEKELQQLIAKKDEELRSKQTQVDDMVAMSRQLRTELEEERIGRERDNKKAQREIVDLSRITDSLREKLDQATKVSFERPDGIVRWIDNQSRTVTINLGYADRLVERTTFSVYTQDHHGVARGAEDIKGSIEVINVLNAHSAVARILEDDIYRPILPGDPIYSPLWSPGRQERIAFVGIIDLDGDGTSDRVDLHDLVSGVGATIDHEVLDDGRRVVYKRFPDQFVEFDYESGQSGIDVNTKFLVIGKIPDPNDVGRKEEKDKIADILKHLEEMRKEARKQGVRIVNLSDFLSWAGFQPKRRLYIPGVAGRPFNLKAGAQSTAVDEAAGARQSSGQVSGMYGRSRRLKQQSSTGQTSGLFRSGAD